MYFLRFTDWFDTPIISIISLELRGIVQKLTISFCSLSIGCLCDFSWLFSWLLFFLTMMTNSWEPTRFSNITSGLSSRARIIPLPAPVYGSKKFAFVNRNKFRGIDVPFMISSTVKPLGNSPWFLSRNISSAFIPQIWKSLQNYEKFSILKLLRQKCDAYCLLLTHFPNHLATSYMV